MYVFIEKSMKHGDAPMLRKREIECVLWIRKNIKDIGFIFW